jgi:hypothetical protein
MGEKSITLQLSDELYESVQEAAEASERPLEDVLLESIGVLFRRPSATVNLERLLNELADYTDAQLWAVVYRRLPWTQSLRLRELNGKGSLIEAEQYELEQLIDQVDRNMLLRSEALLLLKQRGQDVDSYLKIGV